MISLLRVQQIARFDLRQLCKFHYCKRVCTSTDKAKSRSAASIIYKPSKIQIRRMLSISITEKDFRTKVGIPSDYELIYKPPLSTQIIAAQGVGAFCTVGVTATCGIQFLADGGLSMDESMIASDYYELLAYLTGLVLINLGVVWVASSYIIRIYNKGKTYIAVLPRGIPALHSTLSFSTGDVVQLRPWGIMPWKYNMFKIKGKSYIILSHHFYKPQDFNVMLGIDKT